MSNSEKYVPPHLRSNKSSSGPACMPPPPPNQGKFSRGYGGFGDNRSFGSSQVPQNDRWKQPSGPTQYASSDARFGGDFIASSQSDWGSMTVRDERREYDLFGDRTHTSGINFEKYDAINVEVSGEAPPEPMHSFENEEEHIGVTLHTIIKHNVSMAGYSKPTPVQKHAIPIVASGRDLMACAQTGSGKTAAFLIPILNSMYLMGGPPPLPANYRPGRSTQCPTAMILAPTRELAIQIYEEALKFAYRSRVRACVVYGGAPSHSQIRDLGYGCHIIVGTPGRLTDMIDRGKISVCRVRFLVLDEADRMLDMGFEPQIRRIVEARDMPRSPERQTLMFSATFPKEIQILASDFLDNYIFLSVGRVGSTSANITQHILWVETHQKFEYLVDILHSTLGEAATKDIGVNDNLVLVFTETKRGCDLLDDSLYRMKYRVTCIHGDKDQSARESSLMQFRTGQTPIMIATAVAARGLDIPNIKHVINYELPRDIDEYVHRIGRTGRVGNLGVSTSFFNEQNRNIAKGLVGILKDSNQDIPDWLMALARTAGYSTNTVRTSKKDTNAYGGRDFRGQAKKTFQHSRPLETGPRASPPADDDANDAWFG